MTDSAILASEIEEARARKCTSSSIFLDPQSDTVSSILRYFSILRYTSILGFCKTDPLSAIGATVRVTCTSIYSHSKRA
jgi:hypothetical protein